MASLKEVKTRINSVKSTRQITSAMKMVASAKLHKAESRIAHMLPYQEKLLEILTNFLRGEISVNSPFTQVRPLQHVALVPFASNTSLCGAYNANVQKQLEARIHEYARLGSGHIHIYPVGKKMEEATLKLGITPHGSFPMMAEKPSYAQAAELADTLMQQFAAKEVDRVELIYHHFKSKGTQVLTWNTWLPIDLTVLSERVEEERQSCCNYIIEPSVPELVNQLLPKVLSQQIYTVLLDANASEHAARTLAMQTATDNANELIQDLTKQYNKTRQQAITNELLDIVAGSMK